MRATHIITPVRGASIRFVANAGAQTAVRRIAALWLLFVLSLTGHTAYADATSYSTTQRPFKVGILLLDSTIDRTNPASIARGAENPDPYVFYIADAYTDLKPSNWVFVNPLAPTNVTSAIRNRWLARDPRNPYQIGQKVTKAMAAYWEVPLAATTVEDLLQFDLLLIHTHRTVAFTPADREKLRKLVDAGGIIWMEDCGNLRIDPTAPFFLSSVQFQSGGGGGPKPIVNVPEHPILSSPFQLTFDEVSALGDKNYRGYSLCSIDPTNPANVLQTAPNPETLVNIVGNGNVGGLPYIAAGNYGGGSVILSSADSCCDINDYAGGVNAGFGGNSGAFSGPNIKTAHAEDLKLLYNIAAWGSANNAYRRNNRRLGASFEGVGAPLVTAFSTRNAYTEARQNIDKSLLDSRSAPLIVNNVMFVAGKVQNAALNIPTNQVSIRAYDLTPYRDLDGDGNPDDGLPDLTFGFPYDEIWRFDGPVTANGVYPSAPIYGSVLLPSGVREDRIFVTLPNGSLLTFTAFPRTAQGIYSPVSNPATLDGTGGLFDAMPMGVAPSPTFFENRLYILQPNGLVACVDARTNTELWRTFQGAAPPGVNAIKPVGTPTLGFARQDSNTPFARDSGNNTNDLMLYVPCMVTESDGTIVARIYPYWLGTRNEVLSFKDNRDPASNSGGILNTRIAGGPGGPQAEQYFMANGGAFIVPTARVYSANTATGVSAFQNYAVGNVSPAHRATVDPNTGKVTVTEPNPSADYPDPQPGADLLVAVDYDVAYIVGNNVPANYASNPTQVGARNNDALRIPFAGPFGTAGINGIPGRPRGLTTPTFSPEDFLIFGVQQLFRAAGQQSSAEMPSIFAVNEQEGIETSRVRWRYLVFNDAAAPGALTVTKTVDETTVEDRVPLVNYLRYDANWPASQSATRMTNPEALRNIKIVGSPITANSGITYVLAEATSDYNTNAFNPIVPAEGGNVTILMAFKTNPQIILNLPEPFETARGVTLSQFNAISSPIRNPPEAIVVRSGSPQLILDGDRGRITVVNSRAANNQAFSASQSFVVRYTPKGGGSERRTVVNPVPRGATLTYGAGSDEQGNDVTLTPANPAFTPLLWYYVLPGGARTSPTLVGDYIYYTMTKRDPNFPADTATASYIVAVDANPAANDGQIRVGYGEPVLNMVSALVNESGANLSPRVNHVRMAFRIDKRRQGVFTNSRSFAPPVGGQGMLLLNTSLGTTAFNDTVTAVADNRRLVEVAADSSARWVVDSTLSTFVAGGALPVFGPDGQPIVNPGDPNPNGRQVLARVPLARPTALQRVNSEYLMADTGNNRVLRIDRGGRVVWQLSSFADPYRLLTNGEPTSLSGPTDAQYYTTQTLNAANQVVGYEIHYLIADPGNYRIIEVADYYDQNGLPIAARDASGAPVAGPGEHVLVWTSRTGSVLDRKYRYESLQRFLGRGPVGDPVYGNVTGYPYIAAVVSNSTVATGSVNATTESTGGAIVSLRYAPLNTAIYLRTGAGTIASTILWPLPAAGASALSTIPTGNGLVGETIDQANIVRSGQPPIIKKIIKPTYYRQLSLPDRVNVRQRLVSLICDQDGVFVIENTYNNAGVPQRNVLWMFTQADYDVMNAGRLNNPGGGKLPSFRPAAVQLLANGNFLITNSASERNALFANGQFVGEAFEVEPPISVLTAGTLNAVPTQTGGAFGDFAAPRLEKGLAGATGVRSLNRQVMGNPESNTGLLEQPQIAIRP
ncbi:MAG: hypothetical protein SFU56_15235 [Capsulimonadales bacterium]|nr:hypothetical protein [Capsulimonadales bacterium]